MDGCLHSNQSACVMSSVWLRLSPSSSPPSYFYPLSLSSVFQYSQGGLPSICELKILEGKLTLHIHCPRCMKIDLNLTKENLADLDLGRWSRRISSYYGRAMKSYKFLGNWNWKWSANPPSLEEPEVHLGEPKLIQAGKISFAKDYFSSKDSFMFQDCV